MISSKAKNPNCGYAWMDYITSPKAQAAVAEYFGEAPANPKACDLTSDTTFCDTYHAEDADYAAQIHYWTTPIEQCLDGRTDVEVHRLRRLDDRVDRDQGLTPVSGLLDRRPGLRVGLLLTPPMLWLGVAYLGALAALLDHLAVVPERLHRRASSGSGPLENFRTCSRSTSTGRSPSARSAIAVLVTVVDAVLAFPIALFMAKVASPRAPAAAGDRGADAAVGVLPGQGLRLARDVLRRTA